MRIPSQDASLRDSPFWKTHSGRISARVRCTAVALGFNTTLGIVGGLTPLVATWLVQRTGDELAPGFLIIAAAAVSLLAVFGLGETYRKPIGAEPLPQPG